MKLDGIHIIEYQNLQKEINQILSEISTLEKYAVASSGGIFTWILGNKNELSQIAHTVSYFLPSILVFAFGLVVFGLFERLKLISRYIREKYEKTMNIEHGEGLEFGWETYLNKSLNNKGSSLAYARLWLWIFLLLIDLVIAILLCFKPF